MPSKINLDTYHIGKYKHLVDNSCPDKFVGKVHIHMHDGYLMWCTLNQTDLETNSNKYYIMQILKHDSVNSYFLTIKSGRVGNENKRDFKCFLQEEKALEEFKKIFAEKTGYHWSERFDMKKKDNKYDYLEMEVDKDNDTSLVKTSETKDMIQLDPIIKHLMTIIFDVKAFESTLKNLKIDITKAPLGKISNNQITKAYTVLTQIQELINSQTAETDKKYIKLSSDFYTFIPTRSPYSNNAKLVPITNEQIFKEKCDLLEALKNMEIAGNIMASIAIGSSQIWNQYQSLNAEIKPLTDSYMTQLIHKYARNTHGATHYSKLNIRQIYEINRKGESERYETCKGYGNRQLLWHGSRLTNYIGIISQGLRIAPPEAPKTGYMFGKGVYFANSISKSANYMFVPNNNGQGLMLLCEVALGEHYQCKQSEYVTQLPAGMQSTWGIGTNTPNISEMVVLQDGLKIPLGKLVTSNRSGLSLIYDEYIVYDVAQIKVKYALLIDITT